MGGAGSGVLEGGVGEGFFFFVGGVGLFGGGSKFDRFSEVSFLHVFMIVEPGPVDVLFDHVGRVLHGEI